MKELTIEQKAKAYDGAKARMIRAFNSNKCTIGFMNEIFPELKLKESEDEKIRKALIKFVKVNVPDEERYIAWLEKQGEKPTDKIESKFKLGDWVVDNFGYVWQIEGILNQFYILEGMEGGESRPTIKWVNKTFHLWTISENAKSGDVLCVKYGNDEITFIFTGKQDDIAYCALNSSGEFVLSIADWLLKTSVLPATKKQRDTLFAKMKEAGYKWDAEKKKLEKIPSALGEREIEPKSKFNVNDIIQYHGLGHNEYVIKEVHYPTHYINELGERMDMSYTDARFMFVDHIDNSEDNRHEWSEEDESYLNTTIAYLKDAKEFKKNAENCINWLKSLKPKSNWKPSEDQMNALASALSLAKKCGEEGAFDLRTLYEQLNELKQKGKV